MADKPALLTMDSLKSLLRRANPRVEGVEFDKNTDLGAIELLDSFGLLQFALLLEESQKIKLSYADMHARNFRSMTTIAEMLQRSHGIDVRE